MPTRWPRVYQLKKTPCSCRSRVSRDKSCNRHFCAFLSKPNPFYPKGGTIMDLRRHRLQAPKNLPRRIFPVSRRHRNHRKWYLCVSRRRACREVRAGPQRRTADGTDPLAIRIYDTGPPRQRPHHLLRQERVRNL